MTDDDLDPDLDEPVTDDTPVMVAILIVCVIALILVAW